MFELYSIPSFEVGKPELVSGAEIGSNKQVVQPGSVLLSKINPRINRAWLVADWSSHAKIASTEWLTFPPHPTLEPKYLMYWLRRNQVRDHLASNASGVGGSLMRVKGATLEGLTFPLPDKCAQAETVAEIEKQFSRLDEAVANLQRVKANLAKHRASTLRDAMEARLLEPSASWPTVALATVAEVQLGQQRAPVHADAVIQLPYIRAANITWSGLNVSDINTMGFPNPERYRLAEGDLLLSEASGSAKEVGKPALWRNEIPGACYQKTLIRVRCDRARLLPEFAYYFFLHTCLCGQFAKLAPGVGILHLTAERMLSWPTTVPPLADQRRIVAEVDRRLSIARGVEAQVDANLKRAQALRQAVLAKAFSATPVDR
jgi:type I restriction enzyme S subunit